MQVYIRGRNYFTFKKYRRVWARSDKERATTFATHANTTSDEPIEFKANKEAKIMENQLNLNNSGCELITSKIKIELPFCTVYTISLLYNPIKKCWHCPVRWKKSIIIKIPILLQNTHKKLCCELKPRFFNDRVSNTGSELGHTLLNTPDPPTS